MFGVSPCTFSTWKRGIYSPGPAFLQVARLLVMIRIGLPRSTYDLIHPPSRETLEILVDRFLEWEQLDIARRRLRKEKREAARLAKVAPKLDTPSVLPPEST